MVHVYIIGLAELDHHQTMYQHRRVGGSYSQLYLLYIPPIVFTGRKGPQ